MAGRQLSDRNEGSATLGPTRTRIPQQGLVAACVAAVAFFSYYATLVPGLDLGDSASFQTGAGFLTLTPRQAYPLYYALGNLFVWLHPGEPARAMNLASAVYGAIGAGLAALLTIRLTASITGGAAAGLFLAFSYTYWSQAITAEVYTLHLLIVGAAALAILSWAGRPTAGRLAVFYAVFALGFGNHLSMVLLLPAFTIFLLLARRPGPGDPLRPQLIVVAAGIAALGALQYAWNLRGLWADLEPPASLVEALGRLWFDVTKADWRETLVMTVSETGLQYRPAMYWFDLRQQFGVPGVGFAALGAGYVLWRWPVRGVLIVSIYAANMLFAWTYNVGDAYIFFLPAHYAAALCAGAGVAAVMALSARLPSRAATAGVAVALLIYPAWRGYDTFAAVDRSWDDRAVRLLDELTNHGAARPAQSRDTVLGLDANWQLQNAVEYYMRERRPGLPWFTTDQFEWLLPDAPTGQFETFLRDNGTIGRHVVATGRTAERVNLPASQWPEDADPHFQSFSARIEQTRAGTPYVLAILRTDREYLLNATELAQAWTWLAPGVTMPEIRQYVAVAGRVGERPVLIESADRPYRVRARVEAYNVDIRMESWLPTDTIRRAGFGHVVVNRRHALTLERGLSFVALGAAEGPIYQSSLFAPVRQYALRPNP